MVTLYSYPSLFGVADNNGYGLKVFAFMRLAGLAFVHEHVFDASAAPRGQLPYIVDDGETVGDSDTIIAHLTRKHGLTIDAALDARQRDLSLLVMRLLDDLYWVMSYSRWKDGRYWPAFRAALLSEHPSLNDEGPSGRAAKKTRRSQALRIETARRPANAVVKRPVPTASRPEANAMPAAVMPA